MNNTFIENVIICSSKFTLLSHVGHLGRPASHVGHDYLTINVKIFINVHFMEIIGKMNLDRKRVVFFGLE